MEFFTGIADSFEATFITQNRWKLVVEGFGNTLLIALFATLLGVLIGVIVAICRVETAQTGKLKILDKILAAYVAVIRGTPVVLQVMIMYYIVLTALKQYAIIIAIIAFGLNSGAYVSEIIRAGIMSIDIGQMEAGRSLGLSRLTTMKSIILPQAFKNILPALGNEFIAVLKETSVVGFIPVTDLTKSSDMIIGATFNAFFPLISVAVIYFILVAGLSALVKKMERSLAKSDRS